ncbi:hypothetical protein MMC07_007296 [Pseudocyphellaria aurata]|nr:hypothetical protein [Pseudocyphellaria aurata]
MLTIIGRAVASYLAPVASLHIALHSASLHTRFFSRQRDVPHQEASDSEHKCLTPASFQVTSETPASLQASSSEADRARVDTRNAKSSILPPHGIDKPDSANVAGCIHNVNYGLMSTMISYTRADDPGFDAAVMVIGADDGDNFVSNCMGTGVLTSLESLGGWYDFTLVRPSHVERQTQQSRNDLITNERSLR